MAGWILLILAPGSESARDAAEFVGAGVQKGNRRVVFVVRPVEMERMTDSSLV